MRQDTFHNIVADDDLGSIFLTVESKSWKRPKPLTLENLGGVLNVKLNEDISEKNVTAIKYAEQEDHPEMPPNTHEIDNKTYIAIDENYLYVWISSLKKWKRALISTWELDSSIFF